MENIKDLIIKKQGLNEDSRIEINEVTVKFDYKIHGARYYTSAWRFNIDPVPVDKWIYVDGKLRAGYEILEIIKEKKIIPKTKEEALNIAKLINFMESNFNSIYPDFSPHTDKKVEKPKVKEYEDKYEVVMYISDWSGSMISKVTFVLMKNGNIQVSGNPL